MEKILLIEPGYKNKYVPLGLMKIGYYHKVIKGDLVWFCKGRLPKKVEESVRKKIKTDKYHIDRYGEDIDEYIDTIDKTIANNSWDRIYITTLFTFEYEAVIEAINYAKSIIGDNSKIYVGGIMATLMTDKLKSDTGVNVVPGQLTDSSLIGYYDGVNVDVLTPDYSILANTTYKYANDNAYYSYTTRGCGMNCGFCAVKTLEPEFVPYISIKEQIRNIDRLYGPKKDLLLMDNNILKSRYLEDIVKDLIELGFYKGAEYFNPKTKRYNKRYIDFNQGLDAKLVTEKKAALLGKLALRPARVAYDHIEDTETYVNALKILIRNGTTYLSNYLLYNADSFTGKGTLYNADRPEDLYERLRVNVELQKEENEKYGERSVQIYSFPMRYIPLDDKTRGYVGPKWSKKTLRAIQVLLVPTHGKGVSNPKYFYNIFGNSVDEFLKIIRMPERYLSYRGIPQKDNYDESYDEKLIIYNYYLKCIEDWEELYSSFNEAERKNFEEIISNNKFEFEDYEKIQYDSVKKIYLHYVTPSKLMGIFEKLISYGRHRDIMFIKEYIEKEATYIYSDFIESISLDSINRGIYKNLRYLLEESNVIDMLDSYESNGFKDDNFYNTISHVDEKTLYKCIHTWIRNRRIEGLLEFAIDVGGVIFKSEKIVEEKRSEYIKQEMLSLFKNFLKYNYPSGYKLSDRYDLYKYDIMIADEGFNPYAISNSMRECRDESIEIYSYGMDEDELYDYCIKHTLNIYYNSLLLRDEYEFLGDMYEEIER